MTPTTVGVNRFLADLAPADHGALLEQAFDLLAILQLPEMHLQYLSAPGRALLQLSNQESVGDLPWSDFVTSATGQTLRVHGQRVVGLGRAWRGTGMLRTRTGREIPVRLAMKNIAGPDATRPLALVTALDDSRMHHLQLVLRNEQLLLNALFTTLPEAVYFKDQQSRFIRGSAGLARKLGASGPEILVGQTDADYFSAEHAQQALADEQKIMTTAEPMLDVEEKETFSDGRVTWVSTSKFPLRDWRGAIVGTFGISRDITARKLADAERQRMEQQLFLAQKMESIGRLAAGVAHEINTPTQFIADNNHFLLGAFGRMASVIQSYRALHDQATGHPELAAAVQAVVECEKDAELDYLLSEIPSTLEQTSDGISRVARIVRSLREFSHPGTPEKCPANLNHAIETAIAVSRHEWKLVADVIAELDCDLPPVPCVLDQFNQVILNLIVNAAQAIADVVAVHPGERGRITLRTRCEDTWAVIEIADTGTGIPDDACRHIFEPFFTTKAPGVGTGQGLALVHTVVVKNHHGTVEFTTETGRGTTFRLRLPIQSPEPVGGYAPADCAPAPLLAP